MIMTRLVLHLHLIISLCVFSNLSFAGKVKSTNTNSCKVTNSAMNNYEPSVFETTNNLLKQAGEEAVYCGEKIIVSGILLNHNCDPVPNAKIYIWQANCKGKYPYEPLKNTVVDKKLIDTSSNGSFTGSGIAATNNSGEFHFITIYPTAMHGESSHINIRIEPYQSEPFQTTLTLKGKRVKNPILYPELERITEIINNDGTSVYSFEIVLP